MFAKLGKVISSAGSERFASDMHALLVESIPLAITRMTEWTLDEPAGEVVRVQSLGAPLPVQPDASDSRSRKRLKRSFRPIRVAG